VLHPVGPLPTAVYWRRRLLALVGLVGMLGGGGWLGVAAITRDPPGTVVAGTAPPAPAAPPALEQVVPSLAAVQLPTPAAASTAAATSAPAGAAPTGAAPATGPVSGGPCTDAMIAVTVRPDPPSAAVRSKPTFVLVVTNTSPVPCVRALDLGLQEVVLADAVGNRVWGSTDCYPETSTDSRTLQPGQAVEFPVLWSGLSSAPGCAGQRSAPPAGSYLLRGRLDTATSPDTPFTLT
jgi:hypothetical protein